MAVPASVVDGIIMKDAEKDRGPHYTIYILNLQLPTRGAKPIVVNAAGSAAQPGVMVRGARRSGLHARAQLTIRYYSARRPRAVRLHCRRRL